MEKQIGNLCYEKYAENGWNGWIRQGCQEVFGGDVGVWQAENGEVMADSQCRQVKRVVTSCGTVYSKLMWAQNDQAVREHLLHKWLKWGLGRSRAIMIMDVTSRMIARGHLCPEPLLAVRKRVWSGWHLNLLVTREVTLPTVEQQLKNGLGPEAVTCAALELASLHQDGFVHGDFLPRNACWEPGRFYFLDNDKSHYCRFVPYFLQRRNVDQFVFNLMLQGGLESCRTDLAWLFLESYSNAMGWDARRKWREVLSFLNKAVVRWQYESAVRWANRRAKHWGGQVH